MTTSWSRRTSPAWPSSRTSSSRSAPWPGDGPMPTASPRDRYRGSPLTLDAELARAAADGARRVVFHLKDGDRELTPQQLVTLAARGAGELLRHGVRPGDTVGILGPNEPEWEIWSFSAWAAGAAIVPLGFPTRVRDPEALSRHLAGPVAAAGCRVVV